MDTQAPTAAQVRAGWDALAARFDDYVTPQTISHGEALLADLDVGRDTRLLDVAVGSGALAIPAARLGAQVLAVDIAPAMIERLTARATAEGLPNLTARVMDGHALDLPEGAFDVSVSLNGVSLFPDIDRGLAEVVRVTSPGGKVAIAAFGPMPGTEFVRFFMAALQTVAPGLPPSPGGPPSLPFQVSEPAKLRAKLIQAGLTDVRVQTPSWDWRFASVAAYWASVTCSNPLAANLVAQLTEQQREDAVHVLDRMLRERSTSKREIALHNTMTIGIGRR
jgi:SAM-dependent methyltransferase